jgi:hypothetical protein
MADSYLEWVQEDLVKIEAAYNVLKDATGDGNAKAEKIFQVAH